MKKKILLGLVLALLATWLFGCLPEGYSGTNKNDSKTTATGVTQTWEDMTVTIPDEWADKYIMQEYDDGFAFYQKTSYDTEEGLGYLVGFYKTNEMVTFGTGETQLAYTDSIMYYTMEPTDVCFIYDNEDISAEYSKMAGLIEDIKDSLVVDAPGVKYDADEYVLPMSSTIRITEDTIVNFSANELWIARNEIYARKGRMFDTPYLQNYFNSCSWYNGTIEAADFNEGSVSDIEKANLTVIKEREAEISAERPYPIKQEVGKTCSYDLDGDGSNETISYTVDDHDYEYTGNIIVNGTTYNLDEFDIYLVSPKEDRYYITDIASFYEGLEIAILDDGPSADPIVYFFTYNGTLNYIGYVEGFPFKEDMGLDGFANDGTVIGEIRTDVIETCEGYTYWRYNGETNKLESMDTGRYTRVPSFSHTLYADLSVYSQMDETSSTKTIKAQNQVFFTETDGKEWIKVKGKDGTTGYIHILDGKITSLNISADEVFSDLYFAD